MSKKTNFILGLASSIFIAIGSVTAFNTLNSPYVGIAIASIGAIGLAVREYIKENPSE